MPAGQPFTRLCQLTARGPRSGRADLHIHTTHSDGSYAPAQIVELARRSGLAAVAITDHDTLAGVASAVAAAQGGVEVIPGVEITAEFRGRELHLLAYFVRVGDAQLEMALAELRRDRSARFAEMIERLRGCGVSLEERSACGNDNADSLGRRHLAEALVRAGRVSSIREAFQRYLGDGGRVAVPKKRLPVAEALRLVRSAGGVAAWAHPTYDCERASLLELRSLGLHAVEAEYPDFPPRRTRELRQLAAALGLVVTGGSDCHGPGRRTVGARTIAIADLETLRRCASASADERTRGDT